MWKELFKIWTSDNLLERAWDESFEMIEIDRQMFREAVRVLRQTDGCELSSDIVAMDKKVNQYEKDVRTKVMTHCTVEGTSELPSGMVLVSVVIDIERVGDYCKNIVDLASHHPKRLVAGKYEKTLWAVESELFLRFDRTIDVFRSQDEVGARELMRSYREDIATLCDEIVFGLVGGDCEGIECATATTLALYVRFLKRISAHLNNMVSAVVNPFHRIGFKVKPEK